ncbi:MAG: FG-GAP repeat protein [Phycisphaerales bacterium]|nr:FG-GAP repeat protein [Phycisphaerales bacterium]MCB9836734.1 FG-GAP repeat protein [Phycisphaera sp.]
MRSLSAPAVLIALSGSCLSVPALAQAFPAEFELSTLDSTNGFLITNPRGLGSWLPDRCFTSAGDVNGDGFDDVIIGVFYAYRNVERGAGESYVLFGSPEAGNSGPIDLATVDGSNGFYMPGINAYDESGTSVGTAGDINGDGYDEIIVTAPRARVPGSSRKGVSYVIFGSATVGSSGSIDFAALNGTNGFAIYGVDSDDYAGRSAALAGDVNDDGFDDLILGAHLADPNGTDRTGASYVIFGGSSVGSSGMLELSTLNGTNGYVIQGINAEDRCGHSVSSAGDVNGDGVDDLLIGARYADPNGINRAGETYVVFGGASVGVSGSFDLSSLNGSNGFIIQGINPDDRSGSSVSSAGDVNGDGFDDLLIGAPYADPFGNSAAGESYVVFGGPTAGASGVVDLSTLNGSNGFAMNGLNATDLCGTSVSSAGDINNDGINDIVIGAYRVNAYGTDSGESYVIFGHPSLGSAGLVNLSALNGTNGFSIIGSTHHEYSGFPVSSGGDINGDGMDDLLVGAYRAGKNYVIFGRQAQCLPDTNGDGMLSPADFSAWVAAFNAMSDACDQNGDGLCTPADFSAWVANYNAGCN